MFGYWSTKADWALLFVLMEWTKNFNWFKLFNPSNIRIIRYDRTSVG